MASINKLSIRGVRSFSPEDEEQVVEFSFPCTIIVGANGCGKTTIIESLKYSVSGSLPPGNRSGQAFVHDPRSVGQSVVKANVKLRITNRAGAPMVVIRSMEVTQKKTTMTFKQLDGVLRTMDPNTGERVSLSHKCTELDRQIPTLLGVSKPVLEHVVFCHQEDSSWPLMEGAVLKKRFDDIFDSTRYSKALESFRKTKKELQLTVKDLKADLSGLASHKHAAKVFRKERGEHHTLLEELEDEMSLYTKQIQESEEQMESMKAIFNQIEDIRNESEEKENELATHKTVAEKQRSMLEEDLTKKHDTKQIRAMLRDFDSKIKTQRAKKEELESDCEALREQIKDFRNKEMELNKHLGKLAAEKDAQEQRVRGRFSKMEAIAQKYAIDLQVSLTQNTSLHDSMQGSMADETTVDATQDSILSVSMEDMQSFFRTLEKKEVELKEKLKNHRDRTRNQEDQLQSVLTDLTGKLKAIENERGKLSKEQSESQREIHTLSQVSTGHSRLRKSDIEDAKRQAARFAKERDQVSQDNRRVQIPTEIRSLEGKIDKLKRQIEDDQFALTQLRDSAEAQNAVAVLQEQCTKDLECLQESVQDQSYTLRQKYNIATPTNLVSESESDGSGEKIVEMMDNLVIAVKDKFDNARTELRQRQDGMEKSQQIVSESSAILSHKRRTLSQLKAQINEFDSSSSNVGKFRSIVKELSQMELSTGRNVNFDEKNPQDVLNYIGSRLEEIEEESVEGDPDTVPRLIKKLKKLAKVVADDGELEGFRCPCCRRDMNTTQIKTFQKSMAELAHLDTSPLIKVDPSVAETHRALKHKFQGFRKEVSGCINDVLNYHRILSEACETEPRVQELEKSLSQKQDKLDEHSSLVSDIKAEVEELRQILEGAKRWSEDANRISSKKMQINQKQSDLTVSMSNLGDRDLKTVERELNDRLEEKDGYSNKINRLNKEMTNLNTRVSQLSDQATRMDKLVRDKEAKYAKEQEAAERKKVLTSRISQIAEEEKKLQEQLAPLRQKIRGKESEKQRLRAHSAEEEEQHSETLNLFLSDMKNLRDLTKLIDHYANSSKDNDFSRVSSEVSNIVDSVNYKKKQLDSSQGELEKVLKAFDDQERHKKMLKENIDLLSLESRMEELEVEIARLKEEELNVKGHDICRETYEKASKKKQRTEAAKARLEGRRGEMVEQIRSLNRKLSTPEYKDIDERHRVAMIKHETTQIAVEDLDKYATALDKALLRFHSIKIADINKIIKELWLLTYKGEDITNIEIVSGQEAGSRAMKAYNYRVVMTKGDTRLDMRGRCSAGQRVLASIVIRLALAETFGVNCGCIALDEPTVNLDYNNKRGLAIALAQIIASRAQQRNFQLILITHDEDFVVMMKTELSTQSGFPMPEKYFQVRREEGTDGKFYSKIDAVDWDELL